MASIIAISRIPRATRVAATVALLAFAVLATASAPASAAVQMRFVGLEKGVSGFQLHNGASTLNNVSAGVLKWMVQNYATVNDDAPAPPVTIFDTDNLRAFCIEIGQYASSSYQADPYVKAPLTAAPDPSITGNSPFKISGERAGLLDLLADQYWDTAINGSNVDAAAFQLAVWELVQESPLVTVAMGLSLSLSPPGAVPGNLFYVSSNCVDPGNVKNQAIALANSWLADVTSDFLAGLDQNGALQVHALTHANVQDQIYQYSQPAQQVVTGHAPEPTTLLTWAGLMATVGLAARRRRQGSA